MGTSRLGRFQMVVSKDPVMGMTNHTIRPLPSVATYSICVTGVVNSREGKTVSILDITNMFLRSYNVKKDTDVTER